MPKRPRIFWIRLAYIALAVVVTIAYRAFWTPDYLFVFLLGLFWLYGQGKKFFYSFAPFIALLIAYDSLRAIVPFVSGRVHFTEMIDFDRWIGGGMLPTTWLQNMWYHGHLAWYDFGFYMLYMAHFVVPLLFGVLLWRTNIREYFRFVAALTLVSYAGFITFFIFPAAPPWMASEMHLIDPIHKISTDIWWAMGVHNFPSIYQALSPNLVAAVPSLHAAFPTLVVLYIYREFGWRWALPAMAYPLGIWLGVVYMGEHYVFDLVFGIGYAIITYIVTNALFRRYHWDIRLERWLQNRLAGGKSSTKSKRTTDAVS